MNQKLNFGCGSRFASGWENIDFYSGSPEVKRVNLLLGLPYPSGSFDAVYSSHVLEHFTCLQCSQMLADCYRVLKPGGIVRVVVPDFEQSVDEYARIKALPDSDPLKKPLYRWIMIEILDQLVRTKKHGDWGATLRSLDAAEWKPIETYIRQRTRYVEPVRLSRASFAARFRGVSQKVSSRFIYWWLAFVKQLVPRSVRSHVFVDTGIGERHLWMYDEYGMRAMLESAGFVDIRRTNHDESEIPEFANDHLDTNLDGTPYKGLSLYMEARRPAG